jgi:hypothetical protein
MSKDTFIESTLPLRLAREQGLAFGLERSFKMVEGSLLWERYLLGIDKSVLTRDTLETLLQSLEFPQRYREQFDAALPQANLVLLGFEQGERRTVLKVYLEFWDSIIAAVQADPDNLQPRLMFLGFKWDSQDPARSTVSRYQCYPRLPVGRILERIAGLVTADTPLRIIEQLVGLASQRGPSAAFKYLEVSDDDNGRSSFDLNLYSGALTMGEIQPLVRELGCHYGIDPAAIATHCDPVAGGILGHISAGLGGKREEFFSIYYEPPAPTPMTG